MGIHATGLVRLRAADDRRPPGRARDDADEEVGIGLLRTDALLAIALRRPSSRRRSTRFALLAAAQEVLRSRSWYARAVRCVAVEGDGVERVERVHADAALEAGARVLPEPALHLVLHDKIAGFVAIWRKRLMGSPVKGDIEVRELGIAYSRDRRSPRPH